MELVQIKDLRFQTIVGCWDWERQLPQQVSIDLDMAWDFSKSVETEKLEYALDYKAVAQRVEAFGHHLRARQRRTRSRGSSTTSKT